MLQFHNSIYAKVLLLINNFFPPKGKSQGKEEGPPPDHTIIHWMLVIYYSLVDG
jgi:hypothetical protein